MSDPFILKNVRLSFVNVFAPNPRFDNGKFELQALINKETQGDVIAQVKKQMANCLMEKYGDKTKIPPGITSESRCCFRDGDNAPYDGYAGHMTLKASEAKKPRTMDAAKNDIDASSGKLYSGCFADVAVKLWVQDNQYGKKLNANLIAVRHRSDGEALGGGGVDMDAVIDEFEDLDDATEVAELDAMDL